MCTALMLNTNQGNHIFGRSMDLEYHFGQAIHIVPRNYPYTNVVDKTNHKTKYAILSFGVLAQDATSRKYPLLADGVNEKGLACAGLNFPGYADFQEIDSQKVNIGPHDVILHILANFEYVGEVKDYIKGVHIVNRPFANGWPVATLHWMVSDKNGDSIVIESTQKGLIVYENKVGVMANSPEFDYHVTSLNQYIIQNPTTPKERAFGGVTLKPFGVGVGMVGIPGDFSGPTRFIRTAYFRSIIDGKYSDEDTLAEFFHVMDNVSIVRGSVLTQDGIDSMHQYKSCYNQEKGILYYTTYKNFQINSVSLFKEDLDAKEIKTFEYKDCQSINAQN